MPEYKPYSASDLLDTVCTPSRATSDYGHIGTRAFDNAQAIEAEARDMIAGCGQKLRDMSDDLSRVHRAANSINAPAIAMAASILDQQMQTFLYGPGACAIRMLLGEGTAPDVPTSTANIKQVF